MDSRTHPKQNDMIDLREIFTILKKRKLLIYSLTLSITILSVLYLFFIAKPVYAARFMVEVAQIEGKPAENIKIVQEKLSYLYKVDTKSAGRKLPLIKSIFAKKDSSLLLFTVLAKSSDEAAQYARSVISDIKSQYQKEIDDYQDAQIARIKRIQNDINTTQKSITQSAKELADFRGKIIASKSNDATLLESYILEAGQKQVELQSLSDHLRELKNRELDLTLSISPNKMRPARAIGEIERVQKPVEPQKALIIIANFITALIVSLFLALLLEFIANMRNPKNKTARAN